MDFMPTTLGTDGARVVGLEEPLRLRLEGEESPLGTRLGVLLEG
jgi:hypothetical protein